MMRRSVPRGEIVKVNVSPKELLCIWWYPSCIYNQLCSAVLVYLIAYYTDLFEVPVVMAGVYMLHFNVDR